MLALGSPHARPAERGDLRTILAELNSLLDAVCKHHRVEASVNVVLSEAEAVVRDQARIRGAVLNLALNAIEAAGPGGKVAVRGTRLEDQIAIEVTDNGPGPPAELGEAIADAFVTTKEAESAWG